MKKIVSAFLTIICIFVLSACGDKQCDAMSGLAGELEAEFADIENASCGVYYLNHGDYILINDCQMRSASLIKLFIAGTVYENYDYVEMFSSATDHLLQIMICQSDNEAANELIKSLGGGNAAAGFNRVNDFCRAHGYLDTELNRLMLQEEFEKENLTSAKDCIAILKDYYQGNLKGSEEVISFMLMQEIRNMIPTGLPEEIAVANKTGTLKAYEADAAIVYNGDHPYILCVIMDELNKRKPAMEKIGSISELVFSCLSQ